MLIMSMLHFVSPFLESSEVSADLCSVSYALLLGGVVQTGLPNMISAYADRFVSACITRKLSIAL